MELMKESGIAPDEITYGAAIDAHRRSGNSLLAGSVLFSFLKAIHASHLCLTFESQYAYPLLDRQCTHVTLL